MAWTNLRLIYSQCKRCNYPACSDCGTMLVSVQDGDKLLIYCPKHPKLEAFTVNEKTDEFRSLDERLLTP